MKRFLVIVTLLTLCFATTSCESYLVGLDEKPEGYVGPERPEGYYEIGDYYNENGKEGIVFEIFGYHRSGKIMSVDEERGDWYDAVSWCENYGDGDWWLPSKSELKKIYKNMYQINEMLLIKGFAQLYEDWYWSSNKGALDYAWVVDMYDYSTYYYRRSYPYRVRAVTSF